MASASPAFLVPAGQLETQKSCIARACSGNPSVSVSFSSSSSCGLAGPRAWSVRVAPSAARFIGVISVAPRRTVRHHAILALDPDFYKIPYVEGVPVGKRLKLWNLPPNCDRNELLDWFLSIPDITVETLEFTDDPELNAQGVKGFVEFGTKQEACMAIVRLDGRKFKGFCIRMDFVEKRPHEDREMGRRRNRPSSYSRRSSSYSSDYSPVQDFQPRGSTATAPRPAQPMGAPFVSHRIFVGNISWNMDENGLKNLFGQYGTVVEARVARDRQSGTSRGFGFVAMSTADEMYNAISSLDGKQVDGRAIRVSVAEK